MYPEVFDASLNIDEVVELYPKGVGVVVEGQTGAGDRLSRKGDEMTWAEAHDLSSIPMPRFLKYPKAEPEVEALPKVARCHQRVVPAEGNHPASVPCKGDMGNDHETKQEVGGEELGTTVMIRNIACRYTAADVVAILNLAGLEGKYTDVHLPINPARRANLGYTFVKFASAEFVMECQEKIDGQVFGPSNSSKRCHVTLAHDQGCPRAKKSQPRGVKPQTRR
jgi:hypothetical protein